MLKIVSDAAADFPDGWKELYEIDILPLHIRFGDRVYLQGVNIDEADFYQMVEETHLIPKTSLPSPLEIQQFYQRIADPNDVILSIHVSQKLSGTMATVEMAAAEMKDEYTIYPFNSGAGSAAMAFMCKTARLMDRSGAAIEQILQRLEEMRAKQTVIFTMDSLEFARLNGRVSAIQSILSSALRLKPILVLRDGLLDMNDKVRTRRRSLEKVLEFVSEKIGQKKVSLAIVHAADLTAGRAMFERARNMFNCQEIILTSLSISVAANLGPGTIGIVAIPNKEEI